MKPKSRNGPFLFLRVFPELACWWERSLRHGFESCRAVSTSCSGSSPHLSTFSLILGADSCKLRHPHAPARGLLRWKTLQGDLEGSKERAAPALICPALSWKDSEGQRLGHCSRLAAPVLWLLLPGLIICVPRTLAGPTVRNSVY